MSLVLLALIMAWIIISTPTILTFFDGCMIEFTRFNHLVFWKQFLIYAFIFPGLVVFGACFFATIVFVFCASPLLLLGEKIRRYVEGKG